MAPPSVLLTDQHREIETACRMLRARAGDDDPLELVAAYRCLEAAMTRHFEAEEQRLLPAYAEHFPATARQIREEHEQLRQRLLQLAIDVELHLVRVAQIDELAELFRSHVAFENVTLYRWADGHPSATAVHPLPAGQIKHTGYSR